MIPWYLIISGISTIIFLAGRILICRVRLLYQFCNGRYKTQTIGQCCHGKKWDFSYLVIYDLVMFLITLVTLSLGTHFITELSDRINYATHRPNTDVSQSLFLLAVFIQ